MLKKFKEYLKKSCGCSHKHRFLLAVSGGIDSVVMATLFHLSRIPFAIAHCNFHLRGRESDGDELFVRNLAVVLSLVMILCIGSAKASELRVPDRKLIVGTK